jgi:dienelactone hydrolase
MRVATACLVPLLLASATGLATAQLSEWTAKQPLPRPTGSFSIGTATFRLIDSVVLNNSRRIARPAIVQVWYPSRAQQMAKARYVEDRQLLEAMVREKYQDVPEADIRSWAALQISAFDARPTAPPPGRRGWPALVFSHGFGVSRVSYTALAQELASRGYVVLTIDHPYGGFMVAPDGRVLQPGGDSLRRRLGSSAAPASVDSALAWDARRWAVEAAAAIRRVAAGRTDTPILSSLVIDTTRVGMLGHSLGGAAALEACRNDPIFRACADMDGAPVGDVERVGVPKPFLVLLSAPAPSTTVPRDSAERAHRDQFAQMGRERDSTWAAIANRNPEVPSFVVKLQGTGHFSFSDAPFLMPSLLQGTGSTLSANRAYSLTVSYLTAFFDRFLRNGSPRLLKQGMTTVTR